MDLPWTEAKAFAVCVTEDRRRRWLDLASAVRVAGADQKNWERITRDFEA